MSITFKLEIDLAGHEHPGANWRAQHHTVVTLLDQVKQAVGSGPGRRDDIMLPHFDPVLGANSHVTVGSWEFTETRNPATRD